MWLPDAMTGLTVIGRTATLSDERDQLNRLDLFSENKIRLSRTFIVVRC